MKTIIPSSSPRWRYAVAPSLRRLRKSRQAARASTPRGAEPVAALDRYIGAAEAAWRKLDANPADAQALGDYNFAVSRIMGTLRGSGLKPWAAPIQTGSHTLAWQRDPRPEWNPAKYDFIPTDQLAIKGKYVNDRESEGRPRRSVGRETRGRPDARTRPHAAFLLHRHRRRAVRGIALCDRNRSSRSNTRPSASAATPIRWLRISPRRSR